MSILNADIVRWAGLTKYVIYRKRGAFDSAYSYTLKLLKLALDSFRYLKACDNETYQTELCINFARVSIIRHPCFIIISCLYLQNFRELAVFPVSFGEISTARVAKENEGK